MASLHREVERKYALEHPDPLPDLSGALSAVPGVAAVDEGAATALEALYLDTADLALARARTTLRRRTGGSDAGWHLKLPPEGSSAARQEVQLPLGEGAPAGGDAAPVVPGELEALVWSLTRGAPLVPVARLATERAVRHLRDGAGRVLAEVADDRVSAQRLTGGAPGRSQSWRELEVELVEHADEGLLDAVEQRLAAFGVARSASPSKLARALGDPAGSVGSAADSRRAVTASSTAGEVVLAHLDEQVRELVDLHAAVRLDAPDAVHRMRVATRRLRSALATFAPVLARDRARGVRSELAWWAVVLGGARDAEVLRERLSAAVLDAGGAESTDAAARHAAARHTRAVLDAEHERAHAEVRAAQDGPRYRALVADLEEMVAHPPLTAQAARPAGEVLLRRMRRAHRELAGLVEDALSPDAAPGAAGAPGAHDEALHEARKSAKRARYAAEALAPLWPDAGDYTRAVKRLQAELGEHQDSAVARAQLTRLAGTPGGAEHAFTYGRLHGLEEARARRLEEPLPELWRAVGRRSARRWMKG